jgi:hypothetical protein
MSVITTAVANVFWKDADDVDCRHRDEAANGGKSDQDQDEDAPSEPAPEAATENRRQVGEHDAGQRADDDGNDERAENRLPEFRQENAGITALTTTAAPSEAAAQIATSLNQKPRG